MNICYGCGNKQQDGFKCWYCGSFNMKETKMKDDSLNDVVNNVGIDNKTPYGFEMNVYEKEIWNKAIEAAAKIIDDCNGEGPYNAIGGARRIRELKK